jgi:tRNA pseudouridine55 synthase
MAEGVLIILVGEECKNKEKYLGFDKEYEVGILFGVATDTFDALGVIGSVKTDDVVKNNEKFVTFSSYVGKHTQAYPAYSSKTVNGKQLHEYARAGELPDEMPTKEVEIYSIEKVNEREITGKEISEQVIKDIKLVNGDFRQEEIIKGWEDFAKKYSNKDFKIIKVKVRCSSGTYMRSLADRIGKEAGTGAIALLIKRISVGEYK